MSPVAEYEGTLYVALMRITALVSRNPQQYSVISGVEGWWLVENRIWTSAVWGEPCIHDASRLRETTSEGNEPP